MSCIHREHYKEAQISIYRSVQGILSVQVLPPSVATDRAWPIIKAEDKRDFDAVLLTAKKYIDEKVEAKKPGYLRPTSTPATEA